MNAAIFMDNYYKVRDANQYGIAIFSTGILGPVFNLLWLFKFEQVGLDHLTMNYFYPVILTTNQHWGLPERTHRKTAKHTGYV